MRSQAPIKIQSSPYRQTGVRSHREDTGWTAQEAAEAGSSGNTHFPASKWMMQLPDKEVAGVGREGRKGGMEGRNAGQSSRVECLANPRRVVSPSWQANLEGAVGRDKTERERGSVRLTPFCWSCCNSL